MHFRRLGSHCGTFAVSVCEKVRVVGCWSHWFATLEEVVGWPSDVGMFLKIITLSGYPVGYGQTEYPRTGTIGPSATKTLTQKPKRSEDFMKPSYCG